MPNSSWEISAQASSNVDLDALGEWAYEVGNAPVQALIERLRDAESFNWSLTIKRLEAALREVLDAYVEEFDPDFNSPDWPEYRWERAIEAVRTALNKGVPNAK